MAIQHNARGDNSLSKGAGTAEVLAKSRERVKAHGEVFTPRFIVDNMLDMLEKENPEINVFAPEKTFLEPACGNGNFLVAILERKLKHCKSDGDINTAVGSIYGIDIMPDNIAEAKARMQAMLPFDCMKILDRNIVCGNFLEPENIWFLVDEAEELHEVIERYKPKKRKKAG